MSFHVKQARFSMKSDGIPLENIQSVEETANNVVTYISSQDGFQSVLLLGYVQSGKTNGMIMSLAKMIEAGYKFFVVLTGNDNDLYKQTYDRIECTNLGITLINKKGLGRVPQEYLDGSKIVVFVVQKYGTYLNDLFEILAGVESNYIVIDDEADQSSLNTNVNDIYAQPSTINAWIAQILSRTKCKAYLQVTATPYALLLQQREDMFRPKCTFILEPGNGYFGGQELFLGEDSKKYHRIYEASQMDFSQEQPIPIALVKALCNFLVATTLKRLDECSETLTFMIHIDHTQFTHEVIQSTINYILAQISLAVRKYIEDGKKTLYISILHEEYVDILKTYRSSFEFNEVLEFLKYGLDNVNSQIVNANNKDQISYNKMYTIIIGGNKLSRGITIKNLITTYYTRNANNPNMDTVNQHARMYGYREEVKDVIRVFTSPQILEDFTNITTWDMELRQYLLDNPTSDVIPITHNPRISATRGNVIPNNTVIKFNKGLTVFPHRVIYNDAQVLKTTQEIDELLNIYDERREGHEVGGDIICNLLSKIRYLPDKNEKWDTLAIMTVIQQKNMNGLLMVRRGSKITRNSLRGLSAVLSGADNEIFSDNKPILFLYRLDGNSEGEWDDKAFWVPIFRMPATGDTCITVQSY